MTDATFRKANSITIDPSNVKYGAPDIKYVQDVLDATHDTDRIQLDDIERFSVPWSYYIYQDNAGVTYAMRGTDGRIEFTDSTNPRNPIQSALNTAYTNFSRATIYLAPQTFTFPSAFSLTGTNSGSINLGNQESLTPKSNIEIIGAGMDKTILKNATIRKNNNTWTECIGIRNLTIDAGAVAIDQTSANTPAANDTSGFVNCIDLWFYTYESRIYRVKMQNSRGPLIRWDGQDAGIFEGCILINGGLGTPGSSGILNNDNASGNQAYWTNSSHGEVSVRETIWYHCYFEKTKASRGTGSMLSTNTQDSGGAGRLSVFGCVFYNNDSLATQAINVTNGSADSAGPVDKVKIIGCRAYGPKMGFRIGSGTANTITKALISNCVSEDGGTIAMRKVDDGIVANCIVHNARGPGYLIQDNRTVHVMNNIARNTNTLSPINTNPLDQGGLYATNNKYMIISHLDVYDTGADDTKSNTTLNPQVAGITTPYGISVNNSSLSGQVVLIDNCALMGDTFNATPASPNWYVGSPTDTATTGTSMYLKNNAEISIIGGIVKSASTAGDAIRLAGTNTIVKIKSVNGYNNTLGTATITAPSSSPYTYTNTDTDPEMIHVYGGTLTSTGITRDGSLVSTVTPCSVYLEPGEALVVNYSAVPSLTKDRL